MTTYEDQKNIVSRLNVIDDIFFHKMVEDIEVCEEILKILLNKPDLKVVQSQVQRFLRNVSAHSVILDVLCQDSQGDYFNVEVQKANNDNHQKRLRFNQANIDTSFVEKGITYEQLPDIYLIFISSFDIFNKGRTIYHINRVIEETGTIVENGIHEIYANTAVDDKSDIAELMQYFKKSTGEHKKFQKLCNRVKYYKESQEGVDEMCQLVEDYAKDYAEKYAKEYAEKVQKNNIISLLKNGVSVDLIATAIPDIPREVIEELNEQVKIDV